MPRRVAFSCETTTIELPPRGRIELAVQNGIAGIWYSYVEGHPASVRRGFLHRLPVRVSRLEASEA